MEIIEEKYDRFLPYGDTLRSILNHPTISDYDKRSLLRLKGIYVEDIDDAVTYPLLLTSLLSPSDYEWLKEKLSTREDREKVITRSWKWESDENLINDLPSNFKIKEIAKQLYPKYEIIGNPNFTQENKNPNVVSLEYKCKTENYSKAWFRSKNEYKGKIKLERVIEDSEVKIQITHTAPETTEISNKVVSHLEQEFKSKSKIPANESIRRILYGDFSNEQRVNFFLKFMEKNEFFTFIKAKKTEISHDKSTVLPNDIKWLENAKVDEMNINGEVIHRLKFIEEESYRQYMSLAEMDYQYDFTLSYAEGTVIFRFGFFNYFKKLSGSVEFASDIINLSLKKHYSSASKNKVQRDLQEEFQKFKLKNYKEILAKP